jgi:hypothetical protein
MMWSNTKGDTMRTREVLGHPLIDELLGLGLNPADFVIVGSGPLLAHGLISHIEDLDVVARGETWRHVSLRGMKSRGGISGDEMFVFRCETGVIQFTREWVVRDVSTDDLIGRADLVEVAVGDSVRMLKFASLADVVTYKRRLNRPKDFDHIRRIRKFIRGEGCFPALSLQAI